jgi:hypothetical protein
MCYDLNRAYSFSEEGKSIYMNALSRLLLEDQSSLSFRWLSNPKSVQCSLQKAFTNMITAAYIYTYYNSFLQANECFNTAIQIKAKFFKNEHIYILYEKLASIMTMKPKSYEELVILLTSLQDIISYHEEDNKTEYTKLCKWMQKCFAPEVISVLKSFEQYFFIDDMFARCSFLLMKHKATCDRDTFVYVLQLYAEHLVSNCYFKEAKYVFMRLQDVSLEFSSMYFYDTFICNVLAHEYQENKTNVPESHSMSDEMYTIKAICKALKSHEICEFISAMMEIQPMVNTFLWKAMMEEILKVPDDKLKLNVNLTQRML